MLAQLTLSQTPPKNMAVQHLLVLLPKAKALPKDLPHAALLKAVLERRDMKADELVKSPVAANAENGALVAWGMLDFEKDTFAQQVQVRKALQLLLGENPKGIGIVVLGDEAQRKRAAELAVYGAWVNGALLPVHKKKDERKPLQKIELYGLADKKIFAPLKAQAEGNLLCRELTVFPPNEQTPGMYREQIKKLGLRPYGRVRDITRSTPKPSPPIRRLTSRLSASATWSTTVYLRCSVPSKPTTRNRRNHESDTTTA